MPVIDTSALLRPPFAENQFTPTKWDTAARAPQAPLALAQERVRDILN